MNSDDDWHHMGLTWYDHHFAYGYRHGWGHRLPMWLKDIIVGVVNPLACRIWGHHWFPDFDQQTGEIENEDGSVTPLGITDEICTACDNARRPLQAVEDVPSTAPR